MQHKDLCFQPDDYTFFNWQSFLILSYVYAEIEAEETETQVVCALLCHH